MAEERPETTPPGPRAERDTGEQLKLIGVIAAVGALLIFFFQNLHDVEINFLWFEWRTDMIWALISSAILGGLSVFFAMWFRRRRKQPPSPER